MAREVVDYGGDSKACRLAALEAHAQFGAEVEQDLLRLLGGVHPLLQIDRSEKRETKMRALTAPPLGVVETIPCSADI